MNIKVKYFDIEDPEIISMERAIELLSAYWQPDYIRPALIRGEILHTPFASFKLLY